MVSNFVNMSERRVDPSISFFLEYDNNAKEDEETTKNADEDDRGNLDLITEDKNDDDEYKAKSRLVSLDYFNTDTNTNIVSETIIHHNEDLYRKSARLFLNDAVPEPEKPKRRFDDEGHYVDSVWFNANNENLNSKNENFEIVDCEEYKKTTAITINVPPILFDEYYKTKRIDGDKTECVQFFFSQIRFLHHPLFSVEHILERQLVKYYDLYVCRKKENILKTIEEELATYRMKKYKIKQDVLMNSENKANKPFYDEEFKKYAKKIKNIKESRNKEFFENKTIERTILLLWKYIKYVRKTSNILNTNSILEIKKMPTNEETLKAWNNFIDLELIDKVDELKIDYFEKKEKYAKSKKSPNHKKVTKPVLDYDEEDLRNNLEKELKEHIKSPSEPEIIFKFKVLSDFEMSHTSDLNEINRRKDLEKIKCFIKIFINNKEVCKTNIQPLQHDFVVKFNESISVHMKEKLNSIKLTIFEKSSLFSVKICDISLPIPENNSYKLSCTHNFLSEYKKIQQNGFVKDNVSLNEILSSTYPDMDFKKLNTEILKYGGYVEVSTIWDKNKSKDERQLKKIERIELKDLNLESIRKAFEGPVDPNEPQNALLIAYFGDITLQNKTSNFFLNSDLYMNFDLTRCSKTSFSKWSDTINKNKTRAPDNLIAKKPNPLDGNSNQIDNHRQNSIMYLQSVNNYLLRHINKENERTITNILKELKYPSLKVITLEIFNPKKSLFHHSTQSSPEVQRIHSTKKDYTLKICVFKAFHLLNRQTNQVTQIEDDIEEMVKMVTLRPFVHINCQGKTKRTATAVGSSPTWNEQITFPIRYNSGSTITIQLFDEIIENWLLDDRLEDSTVHYHYSTRWLASLKIPIVDIFDQNKIEGTFLMYSPNDIFGYKSAYEEKSISTRISFDSLKKDGFSKQKNDVFISMYIELFPNHSSTFNIIDERKNSNENDALLQHLISYNENYANQFPDRKLHLLMLDSGGKSSCVTRFFQPTTLLNFSDCLRKIFPATDQKDQSISSKHSTPLKKRSLKTQDTEDNIQSILSTMDLDKRRQSKSMKDTLNDNLENEDISLMIKTQICVRYVSLIPTYKGEAIKNQLIALTSYQTLKLAYGTMLDHTILLMGYFMSLGIECWCVAGIGLPRGFSTYVLIKEDATKSEATLKRTIRTERRLFFNFNKNDWKYYIFDATTGIKYDVKNPFCPLQRVYFICSHENIWANVQVEDRCDLIRFELSNTSDWRPVFQKGGFISCPGPLSTISSEDETSIYNHNLENALSLKGILEDKIKTKVQKWRNHRKTVWNRHCSKLLRESIIQWEKWSLNTSSPKPKYTSQMQQLLVSYQIYGFPLNLSYTTIGDIVSAVKGTQLHLNEHSSVEFALGVEVFPYPNHVYSVWVFFTSIIKK